MVSNVSTTNSMSNLMSMRMQRPDPAQMASTLFANLDTKSQGYLEKSDLQSAFSKIAGASATSTGSSSATSDSSNVDDLFAQLDTDSDGKVTRQEFSDTLKKLADQLDSQFDSMRMQGGMGGMSGMPPPPPPGGGNDQNDAGFTKEELTSQLSEIATSDNQRSSLISSIVENFDKADTDGNGKVNFKEAMAYDQTSKPTASNSATSTASFSTAVTSSGDSSSTASSTSNELAVMLKMMQLMQAYGDFGQNSQHSSANSRLSVSA